MSKPIPAHVVEALTALPLRTRKAFFTLVDIRVKVEIQYLHGMSKNPAPAAWRKAYETQKKELLSHV